MAQAGSNYEKTGGQKSYWTVPLSQATGRITDCSVYCTLFTYPYRVIMITEPQSLVVFSGYSTF